MRQNLEGAEEERTLWGGPCGISWKHLCSGHIWEPTGHQSALPQLHHWSNAEKNWNQDSITTEKVFLAALAALYLTLVSDSLTHWVGATLEFWHKEWLLRLEILQTFDQSDVYWTSRLGMKRQNDKKTKRQKEKKTKRQKHRHRRNVTSHHSSSLLWQF